MATLDTNAIIYYLETEEAVPEVEKALSTDGPVFISVITELELLSSSELSEKERDDIRMILDTVVIVPVDSQIAHAAATLRRDYNIKTPDSIIAATALFTNTNLLTRNVKDFKNIKPLNIIEI
jgi:hypothetical protein